MSKISVKNGFGYYKNQAGDIVNKAELPAGEHELADGLVYIEVADKTELDTVATVKPAKPWEQIMAEKITAKLKVMAMERLAQDGEL